MRLIAKVVTISRAKFHCNRLTTVQYIQDYAGLIFLAHSVYYVANVRDIGYIMKFTYFEGSFVS